MNLVLTSCCDAFVGHRTEGEMPVPSMGEFLLAFLRPECGVWRASAWWRAWLAAGKPLDWRISKSIPAHQAAMAEAAERTASKQTAPRLSRNLWTCLDPEG
ncbi:MAG: hypothetical protein ACK4FR_01445 [Tabrizicola sp.]